MTTPARPLVTCSQCAGHGKHEVTSRNWDTLRRMPNGEWLSTEQVLALHDVKRLARTALIGRLNTLVGNGLVERREHPEERGLQWRRV